jgi:hypothetical protein
MGMYTYFYAEQSRAEQSRAEQSRAEQSSAEQSRAEQSRAEQSRAEQSRAEQSRAEQGVGVAAEYAKRLSLSLSLSLYISVYTYIYMYIYIYECTHFVQSRLKRLFVGSTCVAVLVQTIWLKLCMLFKQGCFGSSKAVLAPGWPLRLLRICMYTKWFKQKTYYLQAMVTIFKTTHKINISNI